MIRCFLPEITVTFLSAACVDPLHVFLDCCAYVDILHAFVYCHTYAYACGSSVFN